MSGPAERRSDLFGEHSRIAFLVGVPEATRLLLIRHAEAEHPGVSGMRFNPSLSELGRRQAAALAARTRAMQLDHIYTSPVRRARETADAIAGSCGLAPVEVPELSEVQWQPRDEPGDTGGGYPHAASSERSVPAEGAEIAYTFARLGRLRSLRWGDFPGFEDGAHLRARVTAAIDRIAAAHPGQTVAIVAHFGVINAYLADLFDAEADVLFPLVNTSISWVMAHGEYRGVRSINDFAHLQFPRFAALAAAAADAEPPELWDTEPLLRG